MRCVAWLWVAAVASACAGAHGSAPADVNPPAEATPATPTSDDPGPFATPGGAAGTPGPAPTADAAVPAVGAPTDGGSVPADTAGDAAAAPPSSCAGAACDPEDALCREEGGEAVCECRPGYRDIHGDGTLCEEIDECAQGSASCADHATCINTPRSYACQCDRGYHGDALARCLPNTRCVPGLASTCSSDATCVASEGSDAFCQCHYYLAGDGSECRDIDECATIADCHPLAECVPQPRGYSCSCPDGYLGDGHGGSGCFLPESRLREPRLPAIPDGRCPSFTPGKARLPDWFDVVVHAGPRAPAPTAPLLFYWHASGSSADEVETLLPDAIREEILDQGGVIVAFEGSVGSGGNCSGIGLFLRGDFELADVFAACAVRDHNVDPRRIYATGCAAGALQAGCMASARSGYLAAVVTNSGGMAGRLPMQTSYAPAVMTMFESNESLIDIRSLSRALTDQLSAYGGYALACNHGGPHCGAPPELHLAAWQFMKDHPFGSGHEGYGDELPALYPDYCMAHR